ncbi:MAG: glycosyltransferase [Chloroflexia bacterium]|nr:glycosyltransferase [Chloroflexia bacterium]
MAGDSAASIAVADQSADPIARPEVMERRLAPRVAAVPAFRTRSRNPFNALLAEALIRAGTPVEEFSWRALVDGRCNVVHIHWPEYLFDAPHRPRAIAHAAAFVIAISSMRARGVRIVWTIHNLRGHEQWHPWLASRMWRWFSRRVDGVIALTAGGQAQALRQFPALRTRLSFVIPHGHYRDAYPAEITRGVARRALGVPSDARVLLFFGTIRPYKNVPELIRAFRDIRGEDWRLIIAGQPWNENLRRHILAEAVGDDRTIVHTGYVEPERVQRFLGAADLVVLPYQEVLNSGSAVLARSFDRPVLVPEHGAMAELQETVGAAWVRTYHGSLQARTLVEAMRWADTTPRESGRLPRALDWDVIAAQTIRTYEAILAQDRGGRWRTG